MTRGLRPVIISFENSMMERRVVLVRRLGGVGRCILLLVLGHDDCEVSVSILGICGGEYNATTTTCSIMFEGSEDIRVNFNGGGGIAFVLKVSKQGWTVGRNRKNQGRDEDLSTMGVTIRKCYLTTNRLLPATVFIYFANFLTTLSSLWLRSCRGSISWSQQLSDLIPKSYSNRFRK